MVIIRDIKEKHFESIPIDSYWNTGDEKELKMHRIHAYPAKFPAFITTKALNYARDNKLRTNRIADIFCGCGTVAFEAKRNNIDFWGCDINPVATMIAKTKSKSYNSTLLKKYHDEILDYYAQLEDSICSYRTANERLKYWYSRGRYISLFKLKTAIEEVISSRSTYRLFFLCAFSNILKPTSRWLTKSIKPQIDPDKMPVSVISAFKKQCHFMIIANDESGASSKAKIEIENKSILDEPLSSTVNMIITSPPYVTSYEYADLHQLSSLWLGYTDDYRKLRKGSIGSLHHHTYNFDRELKRLNDTGTKIAFRLLNNNSKSKTKSVAKYFLDMQQMAKTCHSMLRKNGMAFFVIGDTEYKGVKINNAQHLTESLLDSGFDRVMVTKRKVSKKFLTPYRDNIGRFTTDSTGRKVYSNEYILIGRK